MNFLTIAIILTSTAASASASATNSAEESLRDPKAALKVNNAVEYDSPTFTARIDETDEVLELKNVLELCEEKNFNKLVEINCKDLKTEAKISTCRNNTFLAIFKGFTAFKNEAIQRLEKEESSLGDIIFPIKRENNHQQIDDLWRWAKAALDSEKGDWNAVQGALNLMRYPSSTKNVTHTENEMNNRLRTANPDMEALNNLVSQLVPSSSVAVEYERKEISTYKNIVESVKKWVIANKLFGNPNNTAQSEYINIKSLESCVRTLNVPEGRFSVIPIEPTLNLKFIMTKDSSMTLPDAIKTLKRLFSEFKSKFKNSSSYWSEDLNLRDLVVRILFDKSLNGTNEKIFTVETIKMRVKALKRLAEGAIRSMHEGKQSVTAPITTMAIKSWIMAKQMVDNDGWKNENIKFGLLTVPTGLSLDLSGNIPAPPVIAAAPAPAEEKKKEGMFSSFLNVFGGQGK
jgi:hypothetical protein